jgi:Kef-type K+ transport system membrane component KefB
MGFILRWVFAFLLVALTYNPTDWNYARWAAANFAEQMPLAILFGLLLLVGYLVYFTASLRAIGTLGMALSLAVIAALLWVLYDMGLLDLANRSLNIWLGILAVSAVLGIGMTWGHIWRRISGQVEVDDSDPR